MARTSILLSRWGIPAASLLLLLVSLQKIVQLDAFIHSSPPNSRAGTCKNEITALFAKEQSKQQQQQYQQKQQQQQQHQQQAPQQKKRRFAQTKTQEQSFASDSKLGSLYNQRIKTAGRKGTKRFVDPCKVFIGNLAFETDDKQLGNFILDTMGQSRMVLHSFKVIREWKTGKSKGYGFVEFTDPIYATVCMDVCNGKKLNGRQVRIDQGKKKDSEEHQLFLDKKRKKAETEEEKAISSALDEAENDDEDDDDDDDDDDYEAEDLEIDEDGAALFGDNNDDDIELDALLFGIAADNEDYYEGDEEDDGIFLERPNKFEGEIDPDLNREQRREAARKLKRKKPPSKGFG
jgi:RNA recognition motif-containing protein